MDFLSEAPNADPNTDPEPGTVRVTFLNAATVENGVRIAELRVRHPSGYVWEQDLRPGEAVITHPSSDPSVMGDEGLTVQFLGAGRVIGGERLADIRVMWADGSQKGYDLRPGEFLTLSPTRVGIEEE